MALDDLVSFNPHTLSVHGLVNLDKFTEPEDRSKRGDHGLVFMFQPFRGQWVQAIGAFLSAGATKGRTLRHLILEAIILLENSGFHVDCVSTDGATWNRSMWEFFGISQDAPTCDHPLNDPSDSSSEPRQLHFASDFPHLIKSLWARVTNNKILNVSRR